MFDTDEPVIIELEPEQPKLASDDPLYADAVLLCVETREPTKDTLKRAGVTNTGKQTKIFQAMDKDGFTGKVSGKRQVLVTLAEARTKLGF
jgi:hypothetical protein